MARTARGMRAIAQFGLALVLGAALGCSSAPTPQASSSSSPQASSSPPQAIQSQNEPGLVAFASDEGLQRLARSRAKTGFATLANQYEAQLNGAFCGPTTAAIVLNTVRNRSADLPRDHDRLRPDDLKNLPPGMDPIVPRYTQDNVIAKGAKTRAQVLGEPVAIDGKTRRDFGYQLHQFDEMLRANGLATRAIVVDDRLPEESVRTELIAALSRPDSYAIINYRREAVGQQGGGHISPLAAYDAVSDSFLVLDVNPAAASWVWMPTATLIRGMRTFDTVANRGYVIVSPR